MLLKVPATSANLGPGFDTLGLALTLYNTFSVKRSTFTSIHINGEGSDNAKMRSDNIFVKIFNKVYFELTGQNDTFRFSFDNSIPISRGLGSSSAVIIGAIASAYAQAELPIDKQKILNRALEFESHPDNITPAAMGGFITAIVDRDSVIYKKSEIPDDIKAVVVIPNRSTSTNYSRTTLPKKYSRIDAVYNVGRSSMTVAAFMSRDWELLRYASRDRFHQKYRMKSFPVLFEVQKIALQHGAIMSTLSGSGTTFFNLVYKDDAASLAEALSAAFPKFRTAVLDFDNVGLKIESL